jgi:hypothetical protein
MNGPAQAALEGRHDAGQSKADGIDTGPLPTSRKPASLKAAHTLRGHDRYSKRERQTQAAKGLFP